MDSVASSVLISFLVYSLFTFPTQTAAGSLTYNVVMYAPSRRSCAVQRLTKLLSQRRWNSHHSRHSRRNWSCALSYTLHRVVVESTDWNAVLIRRFFFSSTTLKPSRFFPDPSEHHHTVTMSCSLTCCDSSSCVGNAASSSAAIGGGGAATSAGSAASSAPATTGASTAVSAR